MLVILANLEDSGWVRDTRYWLTWGVSAVSHGLACQGLDKMQWSAGISLSQSCALFIVQRLIINTINGKDPMTASR